MLTGMRLSLLSQALISSLEKQESPFISSGEKIVVSRTVSALAFLYEKLRGMVEYREEHLLRRVAIERILKRRLMLNENGRGIAENLLKEILWAKYLPFDSLPVSTIAQIQNIIDKYIFLRNEVAHGRSPREKNQLNEWFLRICACEIEEKIASAGQREAFINFIFQYFKNRVFLQDESEQTRDIQVYIASHRAFAKSDNALIRFELLKLYFPKLQEKSWREVENLVPKIYKTLLTIEEHLDHKLGPKLFRYLKREIPPFLILRDLYESHRADFKSILENEKKLEGQVDMVCRRCYEEIGAKLARAGRRSIIYIFLTKMVFALALEYPFDRYILGKIDFLPLTINTIFPPFLMFLLVTGVSAPGEDNTQRILRRIREIIYSQEESKQTVTIALKTPQRKPFLLFAFSVIYALAFIFTFGTIILLLTKLHFSVASQAIFLFFLSVVLFFGYRIRQAGKEYVLLERESVFAPIADFFLLPILNLGKWLSDEVAKLNFFVAIFDFIIEAPFKGIFEIFEEWFSFIRKKKEEIV